MNGSRAVCAQALAEFRAVNRFRLPAGLGKRSSSLSDRDVAFSVRSVTVMPYQPPLDDQVALRAENDECACFRQSRLPGHSDIFRRRPVDR
jgi:hypothetical protein